MSEFSENNINRLLNADDFKQGNRDFTSCTGISQISTSCFWGRVEGGGGGGGEEEGKEGSSMHMYTLP